MLNRVRSVIDFKTFSQHLVYYMLVRTDFTKIHHKYTRDDERFINERFNDEDRG